jgi:hypothetical protein
MRSPSRSSGFKCKRWIVQPKLRNQITRETTVGDNRLFLSEGKKRCSARRAARIPTTASPTGVSGERHH